MGKVAWHWSLERICEMIENMILDKFDCFIIIEGNRGLGKSTLAVQIAKRCRHHRFKLKEDLLYRREDVLKFFAERWYSIGIADEMINVSFNRDFYDSDQKKLIKLINMNRDHCNLFIACVPNFENLDTQIKQLCKVRLTVTRRGVAIVQTPNKVIYNKDRWDSTSNQKLERLWYAKKINPNPQYKQLTTFRGVLKFHKLHWKLQQQYEAVKQQERNEIWNDEKGEAQEILSQKSFIELTAQMMKAGIFTSREHLNIWCKTHNKNIETIARAVQSRISREGFSITKCYNLGSEKVIAFSNARRRQTPVPRIIAT